MQERMVYGCCPAVVNEPQRAQQYLLDFADSVLYKDLFQLAEMRRPTELVKLVKYLAYNIGSEVKYGTMANELGIQNKTIERYIDLLEACFIVKTVPSLSRNPQAEIKLGKKSISSTTASATRSFVIFHPCPPDWMPVRFGKISFLRNV